MAGVDDTRLLADQSSIKTDFYLERFVLVDDLQMVLLLKNAGFESVEK